MEHCRCSGSTPASQASAIWLPGNPSSFILTRYRACEVPAGHSRRVQTPDGPMHSTHSIRKSYILRVKRVLCAFVVELQPRISPPRNSICAFGKQEQHLQIATAFFFFLASAELVGTMKLPNATLCLFHTLRET